MQNSSETLRSRLENNDERKEARSSNPCATRGDEAVIREEFAKGLWSEDDCFLERRA